MIVYDYQDFRQFLRDRIDKLRAENSSLSIRELLRRVKCSSPSYYKEVVVDGRKNMSVSTARRFAVFLRLSAAETDYFLLLMNHNQAKTELEKLHYYEQMLHFKKKPVSDDHILKISEYGYMADWQNSVIRELMPLLDGFGNRNSEERAMITRLLRMKISDRQIDDAINLLDTLKFIRKNAKGNYRKTDSAITVDKKTTAAFRTLCQFMDLGKEIINTTDALHRLFKVVVLPMNAKNSAIIEKKINEACQEIVAVAGASDTDVDRLYAMNVQFFPLTTLPEEW